MISSTEEIRQVTALVKAEKDYLDRTASQDREIELGNMVEVPAAVPILDR
ncbi:MAG: putative PEP-binding protein [Desulfobacterales bacterium]